MLDFHFTGIAALIASATLLLHALRTFLPVLGAVMKQRAETKAAVAKSNAETKVLIARSNVDAQADLRKRLDRCEAAHAARDEEQRLKNKEHEKELDTVRSQVLALNQEMKTLRDSINGTHSRSVDATPVTRPHKPLKPWNE